MVPHKINRHNRAEGARRYVILSPCPNAVMKDSTLQINHPAQVPILVSVAYSPLKDYCAISLELKFTTFTPLLWLVFPGDVGRLL